MTFRYLSRTSGLIAMACISAALCAAPVQAQVKRVSTFADGAKGWKGPQGPGGGTFVDPGVGRPAPALRTQFEDFGITFYNRNDLAAVRRIARSGPVAIGLYANTFDVTFGGRQVSRELVVELRDYDDPPNGFPYVSVWTRIGVLDPAIPGWQRMAVAIRDATATELPPGWGGYGAEDPDTFEPMLPPGRTFANVLAGADEIAFTTLVPGFFYGFTLFDVAIDNIFIRAAPVP